MVSAILGDVKTRPHELSVVTRIIAVERVGNVLCGRLSYYNPKLVTINMEISKFDKAHS